MINRRGDALDGGIMLMEAQSMVMMDDAPRPPPKSELASVTHVRKLFPETWLWKTIETSYVICGSVVLIYFCSLCVYLFG